MRKLDFLLSELATILNQPRSAFVKTPWGPMLPQFIGDAKLSFEWQGPIGPALDEIDEPAISLRWTSARFEGWMFRHGMEVYISYVESKNPGQGDFRTFVDGLLADGYTVKVPCPLFSMTDILHHLGFARTIERTHYGEACEVWVKTGGTDGHLG